MKHAVHLLLAAVCLASGLTSCGLEKAATVPEPTRFLASTGTDMSHRIERLPFEHSWRDPKVDLSKYKYIVVRPVTTAYLRTDNWDESRSDFVPDKRTFLRRSRALASYWNKSLDRAFRSPVCIFYKTSDTSRPGTIVLEVVLTGVRFDRVAVKPATTGGPVPASDVPGVFTGLPTCSFEARARDAATGRLLSTASDHRGPAIKVLDPDRPSTAKPNESICDEWSEQLMMSSNIELFPKVRRSWLSLF